jgi:hypothetical protein
MLDQILVRTIDASLVLFAGLVVVLLYGLSFWRIGIPPFGADVAAAGDVDRWDGVDRRSQSPAYRSDKSGPSAAGMDGPGV